MRVRKLLKISAITLVTIALVVLFLVAFFLFNPFERSLPEMRDVIPRGVDFYVHKARIREDFTMPDGSIDTGRFPYMTALERAGKTQAWTELKRGSWYENLGITPKLKMLREQLEQMETEVSFVHLVDDIIGEEVEVAGYFGNHGIEDAKWCLYTRVSWRGKAAFGAMAQSFVRDQMSSQGIILGDHLSGAFYTLTIKRENLDLFLGRYRDCLMVSNDEKLLSDSMKLADGNVELESLGQAAHLKDGVLEPLLEWRERIGFDPDYKINAVEWHLQPNRLFSTIPGLRNWPDARNDENRNEKILASFLNLESYRFLSGSVIFEENSVSFLSHLVVNGNLLTPFQKSLFDREAKPRSKWMNQFFSMVPREACGAAALEMPAGEFIREMFMDGLVDDERGEINRAIRSTRKYDNMNDLIDKIGIRLEPRVGVILRPNRRSESTKASFVVHNASPFPQAAWVFWVKRHPKSKRVMNDELEDLIKYINENRRSLAIANGYKLGLSKAGVKSDVAFEFAIPMVPGTGCIAMATVGEYFIVANSGPLIYSMVQAMMTGNSRRGGPEFEEYVKEMPAAINGVAFVWADKLAEVAEDFENFANTVSSTTDPAWQAENLPRAEREAFRMPKWQRRGTKARIPAGEKAAFDEDVDVILERMAKAKKAGDVVGEVETLRQFRQIVRTFHSAYLQMVLTESSLRVWGRVLSSEYRFR